MDLENEIWKDIPDYEGFYQASNLGRVKSLSRKMNHYVPGFDKRILPEKILTAAFNKKTGYYQFQLSKNNKKQRFTAHRAVMYAFHGKSNLHIDHINSIKTDNSLANLRYVTPRQNAEYARIRHTPYREIGISWQIRQKKWKAVLYHNNINTCVGFFSTKEAAIEARINKMIYYGIPLLE